MSTPAVFAIEMTLRAEEIETAVNRIVKLAGREASREVVDLTPVDTSRAISNWTGSLGGPVSGIKPAVSPGEYGSTAAASSSSTKSTIWAAIRGRRTGQDIWISNNLPYINDLNVGNIKPRSSRPGVPAPTRVPYPRFAERAVQFGALAVVQNSRKIFK